ncbi:MAG TPA: formate dehydrogenase [Casimicrobiaceae bacterium]
MRSFRRDAPAQASSPSNVSRARTDARRRGFLLALGVGSAGAAALAARSLTGGAAQTGNATDANDSRGYRITDHVKRYYQTTKT